MIYIVRFSYGRDFSADVGAHVHLVIRNVCLTVACLSMYASFSINSLHVGPEATCEVSYIRPDLKSVNDYPF